jgi:hypothetical protein
VTADEAKKIAQREFQRLQKFELTALTRRN